MGGEGRGRSADNRMGHRKRIYTEAKIATMMRIILVFGECKPLKYNGQLLTDIVEGK